MHGQSWKDSCFKVSEIEQRPARAINGFYIDT